MHRTAEICLFRDDSVSADLRSGVANLRRVAIQGETGDWETLINGLSDRSIDIVLVDLDPHFDQMLGHIQGMLKEFPDLGILGCSTRTDPQSIIRAMRAGCSQFVCKPIDPHDASEAIARVMASRPGTTTESKRICVVGSAGGVGATTIACNLAIELADLSKKPSALIDLNLEFGDVACSFDCRPQYSLADVCSNAQEFDMGVVEKAMHKLPGNVHVMARPENLDDAHTIAPEGLQRLFDFLRQTYSNVIVDLPRGYTFFASSALETTDIALMVMQLSVPSVRNATRVFDLLECLGVQPEAIQLVLNRCNAEHEHLKVDDIERHFERKVFARVPNDYRRVMSSLDFGQPMHTGSPNSPVRTAIRSMAERIATGPAPDASQPAAKKGIIGRMLRRKQKAAAAS